MLLDTIRLKIGMQVLDIGSGSGFPMLEVAERLDEKGHAYGIDPDQVSIGMIKEKIRGKEIRNATIIQGVAEHLPFEQNRFDLIISNNGLNNVQDQVQSFAECYRVAKAGAQLVTTMNLPHTMIEFYEVYEETLKEKGMEPEIQKMHEHIDQKRKPVEYLKELIIKTGFTITSIQVDGFKFRFVTGSSFLNHSLIRIGFKDPWLAILPPDHIDEISGIVEEKLNSIACQKGKLEISVPFVCFDCTKPE